MLDRRQGGADASTGPAPDVGRVRDGLKVIVFEQTSRGAGEAVRLPRRRSTACGRSSRACRIIPLLAGLDAENLRDWRGEATILPPRLKYDHEPARSAAPTVKWCGIEVPRVWRCGNRGNVASVLIEKPARGDFLPIVDGGFSLQYSPLMEYREGKGMVLFCQMDVTGRTESDPAAETLARNILALRRRLEAGRRAGRRSTSATRPASATWRRRAFAVGAYEGGKLSADQVLDRRAGRRAEAGRPTRRPSPTWLKAGGHLLAIGLDEAGGQRVPAVQGRA